MTEKTAGTWRTPDPSATGGFLLFLGLLAFTLPLLIVTVERREEMGLRADATYAAFFDQVRMKLAEVQTAGGVSTQFEALFRDFRQEMEPVCRAAAGLPATSTAFLQAEKAIEALYRKKLAPWLPRHAVFCGLRMQGGIWFRGLGVFGGGFPLTWRQGEMIFTKLPGFWGHRNDVSSGAVDLEGRRLMDFPFPAYFQEMSKDGRMQFFIREAGKLGMLWSYGNHAILFALLDMNRVNPLLGMHLLTRRWKAPGWEVGFLPARKGKPMLTRGLRRRPALVRWLLRRWRPNWQQMDEPVLLADRLIVAAPVNFGLPWNVFLEARFPVVTGTRPFMEEMAWGLSLLFAGIGLVIAGNRLLLQRGPRFSVGMVLLGACASLILIPVLGIRLAVQRGAIEYVKKARLDLAAALHNDLSRLDTGVRFLYADLVDRLRTTTTAPELPMAFTKAFQTPEFRSRLIRLKRAGCLHPKYLVDTHDPGDTRFTIMVGPREVQGAMGSEDNTAAEKTAELGFCPILRWILGKRNPAANVKPARSGGAQAMETLRSEELMEILKATFGREFMISIMSNADDVIGVNLTFMRIFLLFILTGDRPLLPDFAFLWVWTDQRDTRYIHWYLKNFAPFFLDQPALFYRFPWLGGLVRRLVGFTVPDQRLSAFGYKQLGDHEDYSGWSSGMRQIPEPLWESRNRAWISGLGNSVEAPFASQTLLIESSPGRNLERHVLTGMTSTFWLDVREKMGRLIVSGVSWGAVLCAFFLAWWGRQQFLVPLGNLLEAVGRIGKGEFQARLDTGRRDEFGNVAAAFNRMARGLEEGRLLGRFVSESVKRAVQDQAFQDSAGKGELREVTILFSALFGFDDFRKTAGPSDIIRLLGEHLEYVQDGASQWGGEIDKTIGEKILVVLDHEKVGGGEKALDAALRIVAGVRSRMAAGGGLPPMVGINSGKVIAGILGAESVRLDFTVIGDPVNLAARLAMLANITEGTRVVLSGQAVKHAPRDLRFERLPFKRVKGKTQEVEAFLLQESPPG